MTETISIDPTDLLPGDVVVSLNDHDISGCHCDVIVTVKREIKPDIARAISELPESVMPDNWDAISSGFG